MFETLSHTNYVIHHLFSLVSGKCVNRPFSFGLIDFHRDWYLMFNVNGQLFRFYGSDRYIVQRQNESQKSEN